MTDVFTPAQEAQMEQHKQDDAASAEPQELTSEQQEQLERDLARLLPGMNPNSYAPVSRAGLTLDSAAAKPRAPEGGYINEVLADAPLEQPLSPLVEHADPRLAANGWRWRAFPKGGWVYHDKPSWMQRIDQGQDFEIPWGAHIIAPGWGHVVSWLHDRAFPNGFGSPYMVVYIGSGRFAGRLWYLGHMNYVQLRPGESFHAGRALGRLYNSLNAGRGWVELGHAANGFPMAMGEGAKWHSLFTTPEYRWSH
jgi:murein DD-endopeptidase MepM/ murein hydrolase activator NlpD